MFASFHKSVAEVPTELQNTGQGSSNAAEALELFKREHPSAVTLQLGERCSLSYTKQSNHPFYKWQFSASDDVFCLFIGNLENLPQLRQMYGLTRHVTEPQMVIEAFKVLRDRGPYKADQVLADLRGVFNVVLYDLDAEKLFLAGDMTGKLKFLWGSCNDGNMLVSDEASVLKAECGKSFAPFPIGCYFTSQEGLQSFTHPTKTLKPVPHVDSEGQICGSTFRVDSQQDLSEKKDNKENGGGLLAYF